MQRSAGYGRRCGRAFGALGQSAVRRGALRRNPPRLPTAARTRLQLPTPARVPPVSGCVPSIRSRSIGAASANARTSNLTNRCTPARSAFPRAFRTAPESRSCPRIAPSSPRATAASIPARARARPSTSNRSQASTSCPAHPRKPKYSRSSPGARSEAIMAASIANVPDPHIGSRNSAPAGVAARSGHPDRNNTPAATFSFSGASPAAPR